MSKSYNYKVVVVNFGNTVGTLEDKLNEYGREGFRVTDCVDTGGDYFPLVIMEREEDDYFEKVYEAPMIGNSQ